MTDTNADELRAMLTKAAKTGESPTHKELMTIGLTGNITERRKNRAAITQAAQNLARLATRPDSAGSIEQRVDDIVSRYVGSSVEDPSALAAGVDRSPGWRAVRTGQHERTALDTLASELSHSILSKAPLSTDDLAHLEPSASMSPTQQTAWRASVWEASQEVAALAETGRHGDAHRAARDLAGSLADGLAMPERFDPSEAARRPDGSYDPAALAAGIPR